jgi:hypothetical protein
VGAEYRAVAVDGEQLGLSPGLPAGWGGRVEAADAAHDQPGGDVLGAAEPGERGEGHLGDLGVGDPPLLVLVEDRDDRALGGREVANLGGLALADEGARVRRLEALTNRRRDLDAGALGQRFQLLERLVAADSLFGTEFDSDQDRSFVMLVRYVVRFSQDATSRDEKVRDSTLSEPANPRDASDLRRRFV